jgi:DNA-binding response OmpR family regulator
VTQPAPTVLIVDDTPSKRYVLASWLKRDGYRVVEAATGEEALEIFHQGGIDLVVLDVRLPDYTGFEICEIIKADPVHGTTPVIHVSAAAIHSVDRTEGLERGADAYLVEPINPDELIATASSILRYYRARLHAELLAYRLTGLARLSVAMSEASNGRDLLRMAASAASNIFQTPSLVITTAADGARIAGVSGAPGQPATVRAWWNELPEAPVGVVFHDETPERWPGVSWPGGSTVRVLTVRARHDRLPLYVVVPSAATMDHAPVLTLFVQNVVSALDAMRLRAEEHDLALTLQRSLLPRVLPQMPELDVAVRYVPASEHAEIGGDFYEVSRFGDEIVIAVGDVGGHSLHAATIMAELRHAMRAYLAEGHGPAAVVDRLNSLMAQLIPGEIATLCIIAINERTGTARMANAGHPSPLISSGGRVEPVDGHSPLLGLRVRDAAEIPFTLGEGDTIVLYSDGLIETRTETLDSGSARLRAAMAEVDDDLEVFASRLLTGVGPAKPADDIAIVAVRRHARQH